jgi:hypothetical protein
MRHPYPRTKIDVSAIEFIGLTTNPTSNMPTHGWEWGISTNLRAFQITEHGSGYFSHAPQTRDLQW